MKTATAIVTNQYGLHARPSAIISKRVREFEGTKITLSLNGNTVDAEDLMGVLTLGAEKKDHIVVTAEGKDEEAACAAIAALIAMDFEFER